MYGKDNKDFMMMARPHLTLKQFRKLFNQFMDEEDDPDFEDAIIVGAKIIDDPNDILDGAVILYCYDQKHDVRGTFTVPVIVNRDLQ